MNAETDRLTIGAVAKRAHVHVETLRYYERRGLMARPPRSATNYRRYPEDAVRRVRFIKRAQALGFSLREIEELLTLRARPGRSCASVQAKATAKIADIDTKLQQLNAMRGALTRLVATCARRGTTSACPILESLDMETNE
jgi:MerR family copper efflux transcriptional regulator